MSVQDRFRTLLGWTEPTAASQQLMDSHRASVTAAVKADFNVVKVALIGSQSRGTGVANFSDADLLVVIRREDLVRGGYLISSNTALASVRQCLVSRFAQTSIGRDGQAVLVRFGDGKHPVDVVPAHYVGPGLNNYPVYKIPDGDGGWMDTSPEAHNLFIEHADGSSGGKLRGVSRIMKWWRIARSQPLNSFHLDLLLAQSGLCTVSMSYSQCVAEALALLYQRDAAALQDPLRISGLVKAANTEAKRKQLMASVRESAYHAGEALKNDGYGTLPEAYRQWDFVFNGQFPKY